MDMPPASGPPPRRWGKAIWIGAIAGLIIGMLAMVAIFSMELTPDAEPEPPAAAPQESPSTP